MTADASDQLDSNTLGRVQLLRYIEDEAYYAEVLSCPTGPAAGRGDRVVTRNQTTSD
jgi:hypothetical protein